MKNRGGLVEVLNSQDAGYVYLAHALLQEKGYFVRVENEFTNALPGLSVGVSLMVREEDMESAINELVAADILPPQEPNGQEEHLAMSTKERITAEQKLRWRKFGAVILILVALLVVMSIWIYYLGE